MTQPLSQNGHIFTSNDRLSKFVTTPACRDQRKRIEYRKSGFDFIFTFLEKFMVTRKSKRTTSQPVCRLPKIYVEKQFFGLRDNGPSGLRKIYRKNVIIFSVCSVVKKTLLKCSMYWSRLKRQIFVNFPIGSDQVHRHVKSKNWHWK